MAISLCGQMMHLPQHHTSKSDSEKVLPCVLRYPSSTGTGVFGVSEVPVLDFEELKCM